MALMSMLGGTSTMLAGAGHVANLFTFFQQPDGFDPALAKTLTVFVAITAISFLIIALVVLALAVVIYRLQKRLVQIVEEVKVKAVPIVDKTNGIVGDLRPKINDIAEKTSGIVGDLRPKINDIVDKTNGIVGDLRPKINDIVDDLTPKIKGVAENVHQVSNIVREKVQEFETTISEANQTARDANAKTHAQIDRVDEMISHALNVTAQVGTSINEGIKVPIREATRGVNAVKSKIDEVVKRAGEVRSGFLKWKNSAKSARPATGRHTTQTTSMYPGPGTTAEGAAAVVAAARSAIDPEFADVEPSAATRQAELETLEAGRRLD